jgi:hypothetical protein
MRFVACLGLIAVLFSAGCADKWRIFRNNQDTPPIAGANPNAEQLVAHINHNAQFITSLRCEDIDLDIKQGIQQFGGTRARMACQKPRYFRLLADSIQKREADIGSNDKEFWYWIARGDPFLVHCSYDDLPKVRVPFPFQPEWVMEVLGMAELDRNKNYQVRADQKVYRLYEETVAQGKKAYKVTVFDRKDSKVTDHYLLDDQGKAICEAHITAWSSVSNGAATATIPRIVTLKFPSEKLEMKMRLFTDPRDTKSVGLNERLERELFNRPMLDGVQAFDLARGPDGGSPIRQAGGVTR